MTRLLKNCFLSCAMLLSLGAVEAQELAGPAPALTASQLINFKDQLSPYLPNEASVKESLLSSPLIHVARSKKDAGAARVKGIEAGTAEFILRSTSQLRREVNTGSQMPEAMVSIEHPIRTWGKRSMDASLAKETQAFADIEYEDAMHEGARELMHLWFAYLRALTDQRNANTTYDLAGRLQRLTDVQLKLGEISQLNAELSRAELERISASRLVADAQLASSASAFTRRFPSMGLPSDTPTDLRFNSSPHLPTLSEPMDAMREEFLKKNHELNMMRLDSRRLRLAADRATLERLPDPTFGLFMGRERGGAETISGVMFSIPLPGDSRLYHASSLVADAQAASDKVLLAEQQLGSNFEAMWIQFQHKRKAAEDLKSAAQRQALVLEKSIKAYSLGESSLSDVLMIARMASDNLNASERMHLEVVELLALIRLDMHQIWDFDD